MDSVCFFGCRLDVVRLICHAYAPSSSCSVPACLVRAGLVQDMMNIVHLGRLRCQECKPGRLRLDRATVSDLHSQDFWVLPHMYPQKDHQIYSKSGVGDSRSKKHHR